MKPIKTQMCKECKKMFDDYNEKLKEKIYNYPPEFLLESETEANAKDVLNDIVLRIDKLSKEVLGE